MEIPKLKGIVGGRGNRKAEDAAINQAESQNVRQLLNNVNRGWILSTIGESVFAHQDVTGVLATANSLALFYIPERVNTIRAYEARIKVSVAAASSTYRTALYFYRRDPQPEFVKVVGSEAVFSGASTGLLTSKLAVQVDVPTDARLFMARVCTDATVAVEGFQSGTVTAPRLARVRTITVPTGAMPGIIPVSATSLNTTEDTPMIVYLSQEAANVL